MALPDPARWAQLSPALDTLLDLSADQREAALTRWRASGPALADELAALLAADNQARAGQFLTGQAAAEDAAGPGPSLQGHRIGPYCLQGDVLPGNHAMQSLARSLRFDCGVHPEDAALMRAELSLAPQRHRAFTTFTTPAAARLH